jgi:hypothetical protein
MKRRPRPNKAASSALGIDKLFRREDRPLLAESQSCGSMSSSALRLDGKCSRCFNASPTPREEEIVPPSASSIHKGDAVRRTFFDL